MEQISAELPGRILRAWREHAGMTAAELARAIPTQPSAVTMWETGQRGRRAAASRETVEVIAETLQLSSLEKTTMIEMWQAAFSVDAINSQVSWFHNFPIAGGPVWAWIRVPPERSEVRVMLRWGPFVRRLTVSFAVHGIVVNSPSSVPNPPLELVLENPGWVDFGNGKIPSDIADRLGITTVDARGYVYGPDDPIEPTLDTADERALRPWLTSMQNAAEKVGAPWSALGPAAIAALRPNRTAHALDGGAVAATVTAGKVISDEQGNLVSQLLITPEQVQRLRSARGLSRTEAAKQATELTPASPVTSRALVALETTGRIPDATSVLARLDTIYRADGRLGVERTVNTKAEAGQLGDELTITFPCYWCGHVWLQPRGSHPADFGIMELIWGPWRRRQRLSSGTVVTTRQATIDMPPLTVRLPRGWHLVAGTGAVPTALDINVGWTPRSIRAAAGLIRDNLNAVTRYFRSQAD